MNAATVSPAEIAQPSPQSIALSGSWTARGMDGLQEKLQAIRSGAGAPAVADASGIVSLDTSGAWVLREFLRRLSEQGAPVEIRNLAPDSDRLLQAVSRGPESDRSPGDIQARPPSVPAPQRGRLFSLLDGIGLASAGGFRRAFALLGFLGETTVALGATIAHPGRLRVRPILFNIRTAGFDALPIVGLLSFLLGIVVAYQGADQLRRYGANIFVADLVGLSMLREFAPLITAIIIAGRSGSAYAAQIGTMAVTEEIDAMRTIGIAPMDMLVLPKLIALIVVVPLLTVYADVLGVLGGMLMAQSQLGVGYVEFLDRFVKAVGVSAYATGIGKAPVFAIIIAIVGCFQGFQTRGGAENVGRNTTRSVVQSIFLVIVADALFSIAFSALNL